MLQLPEQTPRRQLTATKSRASARKKESAVQIMIAEHFAAMKARRHAVRKLARLVELHPDLEHRRPLVELYRTASTNEPRYGRWVDDWDRVFIKPGKTSKERCRARADFQRRCEEALPAHAERRRKAGLVAADDAITTAMSQESQLWLQIRRHKPTTLADALAIARHIVRVIEEKAGGPMFWSSLPDDVEPGDYRRFMQRRADFFYDIEIALKTWARS